MELKLNEQDFEKERIRLIEEYISSLPEDRQLPARQFQWKIDGIMRKYKNPQMRMYVIHEMMMDSFTELNNELQKWRSDENQSS